MKKYIKSGYDISQVSDGTNIWVNKNQYGYNQLALVFNTIDKTFQVVYGQLVRPGKYKKVSKPEIYRKVDKLKSEGYKEIIGPSSVSGRTDITSSVNDDDLFIVCEHCLAAIESREGHQAITKDIPESRLYEVDEYNEYSGETYPEVVGVCDWCEEEYPEDELVRVL